VTGPEPDDEFPAVSLGSLDLRTLRSRIIVDDGDLVLEVGDGDVQVQFEIGQGGTWEQAILGAQRLSSVAREFAETLLAQGRQIPARHAGNPV
jgi:hypothetical protein